MDKTRISIDRIKRREIINKFLTGFLLVTKIIAKYPVNPPINEAPSSTPILSRKVPRKDSERSN